MNNTALGFTSVYFLHALLSLNPVKTTHLVYCSLQKLWQLRFTISQVKCISAESSEMNKSRKIKCNIQKGREEKKSKLKYKLEWCVYGWENHILLGVITLEWTLVIYYSNCAVCGAVEWANYSAQPSSKKSHTAEPIHRPCWETSIISGTTKEIALTGLPVWKNALNAGHGAPAGTVQFAAGWELGCRLFNVAERWGCWTILIVL